MADTVDVAPASSAGGWTSLARSLVAWRAIAVAIIGTVHGLPDKDECEAAQRGALPILGSASAKAPVISQEAP
jgi:aquaporin Z